MAFSLSGMIVSHVSIETVEDYPVRREPHRAAHLERLVAPRAGGLSVGGGPPPPRPAPPARVPPPRPRRTGGAPLRDGGAPPRPPAAPRAVAGRRPSTVASDSFLIAIPISNERENLGALPPP